MTEQQIVSAYFTYCKLQKNLDNKTLKAYAWPQSWYCRI